MGIQEDVFEAFFDKLKKDAEFPNEIVEKIRRLWKSDEIVSKEKILNALTGGIKDTTNNQNH